MNGVRTQIVRFVEAEPQPGVVECVMVDALGQHHSFIEKTAVVSSANLGADSVYPQAGIIACDVLRTWKNERGQELAHIDTSVPWNIESTQGVTEFIVSLKDLVEFAHL